MSSSKARKMLFTSTGSDNWRSKLLSRREDGREMWEFTDPETGDTKAIQITYPDGQSRDVNHSARLLEGL